jgi:UDP-N-acetylmuramate--alanine ligase
VIQHHGKPVTELHLAVPGIHNAVNALGALVAAVTEGVSPDVAAQHLSTFSGMRRRFEYRGNWRGIDLIDDYAHHPSAVAAIFRTARDLFPDRRLVAVFEPHQISRTEKLFSEFTRALTPFDECLILPVLAARERASNFQCSQLSASLVRQIFEAGGRAFLMANLDQAFRRLDHASRPGDVVITMGAGRTHQIHDEIHRRFFRNSAA